MPYDQLFFAVWHRFSCIFISPMYTTTHPSYSPFTQLVRRLRHTNARYNQIAHQCRHTFRPTHHAKRRACRVGLRIDTSKTQSDVPPISVCVSTGNEGDGGSSKVGLRGLPDTSSSVCLSPLDLGMDVPVPGAPRLRPIALPEDA